jgi:hypothetical protein
MIDLFIDFNKRLLPVSLQRAGKMRVGRAGRNKSAGQQKEIYGR